MMGRIHGVRCSFRPARICLRVNLERGPLFSAAHALRGIPDAVARTSVHRLRAAVARCPDDSEVTALVAELRTDSREFARLWFRDVFAASIKRKTRHHRLVGPVTINRDVLACRDGGRGPGDHVDEASWSVPRRRRLGLNSVRRVTERQSLAGHAGFSCFVHRSEKAVGV